MLNPRMAFLFLIVISVLLNTACAPKNNALVPLAISYMEGNIIRFKCLNNPLGECFQDVDVSSLARSLFSPLHVGPTFYIDASNVFITFWENRTRILHLNPQTRRVDDVELPFEIDPELSVVIHGRMVLGNRMGNILMLQDNLSVQTITLPLGGSLPGIARFIEAPDSRFIALNGSPVTAKNGQLFAESFVIDSISGSFTRELLRIPDLKISSGPGETYQAGDRYIFRVASVSKDLTRVYVFYHLFTAPNESRLILGVFDTDTLQEIGFTDNPECISVMTGYFQYHDMLYSSRITTEEGSRAVIFNMFNLEAVDLGELLQSEPESRLLIVPFGDYFALGVRNKVILLSSTGDVDKEYFLPAEWSGRDYMIVEYRK